MYQLDRVRNGILNYRHLHGVFPPADVGLAILDEERFVPSEHDLVDPWGNQLVYKMPGDYGPDGFDLYSLGKDGTSHSGGNDPDDINIWDMQESWLYSSYGFMTNEEAAQRNEEAAQRRFWRRLVLGSLWALSLAALLVLRWPRLLRLSPHPTALALALTLAIGLSHFWVCVTTRRVIDQWDILVGVPLLLTLLACVLVPTRTSPWLCILGIYGGELVTLFALHRPAYPSAVERLLDGKGLYLLIPCLCLLAGYAVHLLRLLIKRAGPPPPPHGGGE